MSRRWIWGGNARVDTAPGPGGGEEGRGTHSLLCQEIGMSEMKRLRLADLNDEQFECLRDHNRRAEAHRMLDDLDWSCSRVHEKVRF